MATVHMLMAAPTLLMATVAVATSEDTGSGMATVTVYGDAYGFVTDPNIKLTEE